MVDATGRPPADLSVGGDPTLGLFGPGSLVWKVDREAAVLVGSGARALLLQVAHPKVAAAVAEHSRYGEDPMGRLQGTLDAIYAFGFADTPEALQWVHRVNDIHEHVRGSLPLAVGARATGEPYSALDPTLLLWVYATLIDSALVAYDHFVGRLSPVEQDGFYQEMRRVGHVWGIPPALFPPTLAALRDWMQEMIATGQVAVSEQGRTVAGRLVRPPARWMPEPLFLPVALNAIWLLPPVIRRQFGFRWGPRRAAFMRVLAAASRRLLPFLPPVVREVPWSRAANRRVKNASPGGSGVAAGGGTGRRPGEGSPHGSRTRTSQVAPAKAPR